MEKMNFGIVAGKFYPPHAGHHFLIDKACDMCKEVTVLLCWTHGETIPIDMRIKCLQEEHPNIKIIPIPCIPEDDDCEGWGKYTLEILGRKPDAVFSSEEYGDGYAKAMGCKHVMVDHARKIVPCSGTKVRENPYKYFDYLSPEFKRYYAMRIMVIGSHLRVTNLLSQMLAKHYKTISVPDYFPTYIRQKNDPCWTSPEFQHIIQTQEEIEQMYARSCNRILFANNDALSLNEWSFYATSNRYTKQGFYPEISEFLFKKHNFYILVDNEETDASHISMQSNLIQMLRKYNKKWYLVTGDDKLKQSIEFVDQRIKLNFGETNGKRCYTRT